MMRALITTAIEAGARRGAVYQLLGLSVRTVERWRAEPDAAHARHGPHHQPVNALAPVERRTILAVVMSAAYRDLSPQQLDPRALSCTPITAACTLVQHAAPAQHDSVHHARQLAYGA